MSATNVVDSASREATPGLASGFAYSDIKAEIRNLNFFYGAAQALIDVNMSFPSNRISAIIGPSGCGKSTLLRCFNRMHDLYAGTRYEGEIRLLPSGVNVIAPETNPVEMRMRISMVFQKPNVFPKSIFENVAFGLRMRGMDRSMIPERVEKALVDAALWDEVKDRLDTLGTKLSGGQQQRLTIARALSHQPEILCLDEFSIAVDPVTTMRIEDVLVDLKKDITIILVTNLVQQARRLADTVAFLNNGRLVEFGDTETIFGEHPKEKMTYEYVRGLFG